MRLCGLGGLAAAATVEEWDGRLRGESEEARRGWRLCGERLMRWRRSEGRGVRWGCCACWCGEG